MQRVLPEYQVDADEDKKDDDPDDIKHDRFIQEVNGKTKATATTKRNAIGKVNEYSRYLGHSYDSPPGLTF